jgi:SAM-dependent methyltransferase
MAPAQQRRGGRRDTTTISKRPQRCHGGTLRGDPSDHEAIDELFATLLNPPVYIIMSDAGDHAARVRKDIVYNAELYDAVIPGSFRGDVEWYRARARRSGGPVLELGAGTGRITLGIAADGIAIHALDTDPAMLDSLRQKLAGHAPEVRERVAVVVDDMRTFTLAERFALIIAPFRAFLHNLTEQDQRACLDRVREHLRPDGCFAFNVFHPSLEFMAHHAGALEGVWRRTGTFRRGEGGYIVRSESNRYDTVRQVVDSHHRYDEYGSNGDLTRTSLHRLQLAYLYPRDLRRLLHDAGFQAVQIAGGFDGRPFQHDTDELVIEATLR